MDGQDSPTASADGQDKVVAATAHQIVKSLATDQIAADDMLRIVSPFDHRFSSIHAAHNASDATIPDPVGVTDAADESKLNQAEKVISLWDAKNSASIFDSSSLEEVEEYFSSVDELVSVVSRDELGGYGDLREKAEILIQISMARLEDEFRHLMAKHAVPLSSSTGSRSSISRVSLSSVDNEALDEVLDSSNDTESSSADNSSHRWQGSSGLDEKSERFSSINEDGELISVDAVGYLKDIAERMIRADYDRELCQAYGSVRRETWDECLTILGVERMSIDEVQKIEWKNLDDMMKKWVHAVKVAGRVLLPGERRLCEQIFPESEEIRDECFVESTKGCVMQLLNFGDAVAIQKRSSEKLFRILDMYEALSEMKLVLEELFVGGLGRYLVDEAERILEWLGDAVKGTLAEFATAVQKETSKKPMLGGEIHPLSRYVMNYVKLLVDYSVSLETLLDDDGVDNDDVGDCGEEETRLGHRLRSLIWYLEANLEEKSKLYEDAALQIIFLMNNRLYIVQKVKDSDLGRILGENWVRKRRGQIRQYHNSYLRASWTKALSFLKDDGLGVSGSANSVNKVALKERFRNFNLTFEEIHRNQTTWKVTDPQLREELRLSTSEKIIPAYRSFLGRFGSQLDTRRAAKYIKYTPEDLETQLLEFFEGSSGISNHARRKTSSS